MRVRARNNIIKGEDNIDYFIVGGYLSSRVQSYIQFMYMYCYYTVYIVFNVFICYI